MGDMEGTVILSFMCS